MFGQLDYVHPFGDFQLPGHFEEGCQSIDELLLVNVFYSNSRHRAARGKGSSYIFWFFDKIQM